MKCREAILIITNHAPKGAFQVYLVNFVGILKEMPSVENELGFAVVLNVVKVWPHFSHFVYVNKYKAKLIVTLRIFDTHCIKYICILHT